MAWGTVDWTVRWAQAGVVAVEAERGEWYKRR